MPGYRRFGQFGTVPAGSYADPVTGSNPAVRHQPDAPPPLPKARLGVWHIGVPGTLLWLAAFVVLLFFIPQLQANDAMVWLWTCLSGFVLGLIGLSIYGWQRAAARGGRRGASQMALDEEI